MCGDAACAFRASRLSHFSITTKVSDPYLAPGPPSASVAGPYSMQPCSACTVGMLARNAASTSSRLLGLAVMMAMTWIMVCYSRALFDKSRQDRGLAEWRIPEWRVVLRCGAER